MHSLDRRIEFMVTRNDGGIIDPPADYRGLSTDTKPEKAPNGSTFIEMDTSTVYFYDSENKIWRAI